MSNQRKVNYDQQRAQQLHKALEEKDKKDSIFSDEEFESVSELGLILRRIHKRLEDEGSVDDIIGNKDSV